MTKQFNVHSLTETQPFAERLAALLLLRMLLR